MPASVMATSHPRFTPQMFPGKLFSGAQRFLRPIARRLFQSVRSGDLRCGIKGDRVINPGLMVVNSERAIR